MGRSIWTDAWLERAVALRREGRRYAEVARMLAAEGMQGRLTAKSVLHALRCRDLQTVRGSVVWTKEYLAQFERLLADPDSTWVTIGAALRAAGFRGATKGYSLYQVATRYMPHIYAARGKMSHPRKRRAAPPVKPAVCHAPDETPSAWLDQNERWQRECAAHAADLARENIHYPDHVLARAPSCHIRGRLQNASAPIGAALKKELADRLVLNIRPTMAQPVALP